MNEGPSAPHLTSKRRHAASSVHIAYLPWRSGRQVVGSAVLCAAAQRPTWHCIEPRQELAKVNAVRCFTRARARDARRFALHDVVLAALEQGAQRGGGNVRAAGAAFRGAAQRLDTRSLHSAVGDIFVAIVAPAQRRWRRATTLRVAHAQRLNSPHVRARRERDGYAFEHARRDVLTVRARAELMHRTGCKLTVAFALCSSCLDANLVQDRAILVVQAAREQPVVPASRR